MAVPFKYGTYIPADEQEKKYLEEYDPDRYKKISNTADIAVFGYNEDGLYLLLVRRGNYPYKGQWCLPGGYITAGESLESTAVRELEEETGLSGISVYQVRTYSEPGREPRDNSATTLYAAYVFIDDTDVCAGDDAASAAWYKISRFDAERVSTYISRYSLVLESSETFTPSALISSGNIKCNIPESCEIEDSGGLAFDHARLVIDAFLYLKERL